MTPSDRRKLELLDEIATARRTLREAADAERVAGKALREVKARLAALIDESVDGNPDLPIIDAANRAEDAKAPMPVELPAPGGPVPATPIEKLDAALHAVLTTLPHGEPEMAAILEGMGDGEILDCLAGRWPRPAAHLAFASGPPGEGFTIALGPGLSPEMWLGPPEPEPAGDEPRYLEGDRLVVAVRRVLGLDLVVNTMKARKVAWEPEDLEKAVRHLAYRCGLIKANGLRKARISEREIRVALGNYAGHNPVFTGGEHFNGAFGYAVASLPSPRLWMDPLRNGRDIRAFTQAADRPDLLDTGLVEEIRKTLDRDRPRPAGEPPAEKPARKPSPGKAVAR